MSVVSLPWYIIHNKRDCNLVIYQFVPNLMQIFSSCWKSYWESWFFFLSFFFRWIWWCIRPCLSWALQQSIKSLAASFTHENAAFYGWGCNSEQSLICCGWLQWAELGKCWNVQSWNWHMDHRCSHETASQWGRNSSCWWTAVCRWWFQWDGLPKQRGGVSSAERKMDIFDKHENNLQKIRLLFIKLYY